jgi:hypothetical protein
MPILPPPRGSGAYKTALCATANGDRNMSKWVKSGRDGSNLLCPLLTRKQTPSVAAAYVVDSVLT